MAETRTRSTVLIGVIGPSAKPETGRIEPVLVASTCDHLESGNQTQPNARRTLGRSDSLPRTPSLLK